jgi:predicted RNase H-like HicB family nuclease
MHRVEVDREEDGRWIAEVASVPGVLAYGRTPEEARNVAEALLKRVLAERALHDALPMDADASSRDASLVLMLTEALELLALDAPAQLAWMDQTSFDVDELALQFDDTYRIVGQLVERARVPQPAQATLNQINVAFEEMDSRSDLYDDEALKHAPEWEHIRTLARSALDTIKAI